tara:strand:+ start:435 stop:860 length:426 start_codon:yes stop_codon:yes gene_type:complete
MSKQSNVNGLAKNLTNIFSLAAVEQNKTTNRSVQYHVKKFIEHLEWSIDRKEKVKTDIFDKGVEMNANKHGDLEGAPAYDAGQLLQWQRDWEWHNDQQNVAEEMLAYFKQAQQQMFPDEVDAAKQNAAATADAGSFFTKSA